MEAEGIDLSTEQLAANLAAVRDRMAEACARVRRDPDDVTLVAVTKSVSMDVIRKLVSLGQLELGESRVQQLADRAHGLAGSMPASAPRPRWHMVGHLQRNKVKQCLDAAQVVHSVDSLRLAEEISARAEKTGEPVECLLEVNCSNEEQKMGVAVGAAMHLADQISTLKGIHLVGLMTMAPLVEDPEEARFAFGRLRELFEEMLGDKVGGKSFRHLSMGMSNDFEVAIEEGATMVRIGSALFA